MYTTDLLAVGGNLLVNEETRQQQNSRRSLHTFTYTVRHIRHQVLRLEQEQHHMTTCESSRSSPRLVNNTPEGTATCPQHKQLLAKHTVFQQAKNIFLLNYAHW